MTVEKPYGETYYAELDRILAARSRAAEQFAAHTLYMRERLYMIDDALRTRRAEEAAQEWLRLDAELAALNRAEYNKKREETWPRSNQH